MKRARWFICLVALLLVAGSALASNDTGGNLLRNPSFSEMESSTGLPSNYIYDIHSGDVEFAADNQTVRTGEYSVRIDGWTFGARARVWQRVDAPTFEPEATYRLSAWYRTAYIDDPAAVAVRVRFSGANYALTDDMIVSTEARSTIVEGIHYYFYATELAEDEWKQIEAVFRAPANVVNMPVEFFLIGVDGTVWWDDVSLERVE